MPEFALQDILRWTGGRLKAGGFRTAAGLHITGVSSDSRRIKEGELFIALRGDKYDGHDFLGQAVESGAAALLIDDPAALKRLRQQMPGRNTRKLPPAILTRDSRKALQDLAAGYRQTLNGKVIGITGSVGKTSTRQMIRSCLATSLATHQTTGNLNNEIGLPQTLLQAETSHQAIVLEMGMRGPGEISLLSRIASPDIAVITVIGTSHIGRLGSREAILAAKAEILDGLKPGGLLVLNADDPLLRRLGATLPEKRRLAWISADGRPLGGAARASAAERQDYMEHADQPDLTRAEFMVMAGNIQTSTTRTRFTAGLFQADRLVQAVDVDLPFPGEHHVFNALFGLAVAHEMGISLPLAAAGAADCRNTGNRQRIVEAGSICIMDDSYNASPESMLAALKTMAALAGPQRRKIAALGGMLELGEFAAKAHHELGIQAASHGFNYLLVIGEHANSVAEGARSVSPDLPVRIFSSTEELATALRKVLAPGDCLLIKGSRSFSMEKVTAAVLKNMPVLSDSPADQPQERV